MPCRHHRHCKRPRARGDHDDQNTFTAAPGANQSARCCLDTFVGSPHDLFKTAR